MSTLIKVLFLASIIIVTASGVSAQSRGQDMAPDKSDRLTSHQSLNTSTSSKDKSNVSDYQMGRLTENECKDAELASELASLVAGEGE
ncbi:MAG: hypothetical protein AAFP82_04155, partial [Bacteroidota bacterium]